MRSEQIRDNFVSFASFDDKFIKDQFDKSIFSQLIVLQQYYARQQIKIKFLYYQIQVLINIQLLIYKRVLKSKCSMLNYNCLLQMFPQSNSNQNCIQPYTICGKQYVNSYQKSSKSIFKRNKYEGKLRIRDRQQKRQEARNQIQAVNFIEEQLQKIPVSLEDSYSWAQSLLEKYKKIKKHKIKSNQLIQIFKILLRFPTLKNLQLFEVIIYKSKEQQLKELFQQDGIDIIKVLHSFLDFSCPTIHQSESEAIMTGKVVSEQLLERMSSNIKLENGQIQTDKLIISKTVLNIVAQFCRKSQYVRNFTVLNYKSYMYCLRVHNYYKKNVQRQFANFLEGATRHRFKNILDQPSRIIRNTLQLFYQEVIILQEDGKYKMQSYQYIINAVQNLVKMNISQVDQQIFSAKRGQYPQILYKIKDALFQCNRVLQYPEIQHYKDVLPDQLIKGIITLSMHCFESLDTFGSTIFDKLPIYKEMIDFLINGKSQESDNPAFTIARRGIYVILHSYLYDDLNQEALCNIMFLGRNCEEKQNKQNQNLLTLALPLLKKQSNKDNITNLLHLINCILITIPKNIVEPFISNEVMEPLFDILKKQQFFGEDQTMRQSIGKNIVIITLNSILTQRFHQNVLKMILDKLEEEQQFIIKDYSSVFFVNRLNNLIYDLKKELNENFVNSI